MGNLLSMVFKSPITSGSGVALILSHGSKVLADLASGKSLLEVVQSESFGFLLTGIIGLFAKDFNVTGGTKQQ